MSTLLELENKADNFTRISENELLRVKSIIDANTDTNNNITILSRKFASDDYIIEFPVDGTAGDILISYTVLPSYKDFTGRNKYAYKITPASGAVTNLSLINQCGARAISFTQPDEVVSANGYINVNAFGAGRGFSFSSGSGETRASVKLTANKSATGVNELMITHFKAIRFNPGV